MEFEQWLLLLFGLVSILVYTLIIVTLKRQRSTTALGGSFFHIVEIQYYSEVVFFIEFTISMRLRKYSGINYFFKPDSELHGVLPRIISCVHYYIKIVVYIGYLAFAVNRLSSAINISSYNSVNISIWTPSLMKKLILVKWLLPLIFVIPTHAYPGFDYWLKVTSTSLRLANDDLSTQIVAYIDGIWCLSTCMFCMACYTGTVCLIRKNWAKMSSESVGKKTRAQSKAERSLLISAILSFLVLMLNTVVQIVTIITSWGELSSLLFVQDLSYPMIDLMYSHFPWALLVTSSVLRRQMIYDVKITLRTVFGLDDASIHTVRVGQPSISPATRVTIRSSIQ